MTVHHPNAEEFLDRDCENVAAFFGRQGHGVTADDLKTYILDQNEDEGVADEF